MSIPPGHPDYEDHEDPYPTAWAYEQVCAALHVKEAEVERLRGELMGVEHALGRLEVEDVRLRGVIEDAPHAEGCEHVYWGRDGTLRLGECTCWKADALSQPIPTALRTDYGYWPVIDPSTIRDVQPPARGEEA